jgi:hypothetical protein
MRTPFVALLPISLAISLASPAPIGGNSYPFSVPGLFDSSTPRRPPPAGEARALFERLKRLQGKWKGTSTKGWSDRVLVQVIAGGSVILFDSFDAHPNEKMLTIVHFDRDRLLLTHYCVAGNQPRMQATSISDGGSRATFSFLDATNLPSRDTGHMDSVKFQFRDDDHYTEQWSWYQKGQERWMEQIEMVRLPEPSAAAP